ncbi:MAG: purine-nucleoside phosphorylase [Clostridium sp.]|nr:purine-nucleoside phosphorylase [Clostridium sp.]
MNGVYEKLQRCLAAVKSKAIFEPKAALVLGSGLGDYAEQMDIKAAIDYSDIEGFPTSTVAGHKGRFIFGYVEEVPVVAMQGRVHYYEGYPMSDVVLPVRLMGLMGAKTVILTNAAGGMNPSFVPGDLMMITDHITSFVPSPLIGENVNELGTRFPDMSEVYGKKLRELIKQAARNTAVSIQQGVYLQTTGPNYETPAEIRMYRLLGGDAVGMSTACEAMAARHMGLNVCGISCITNMAAGISPKPLNHSEVQETADKAAANFKKLVTELIRLIGEDDYACESLYN